MNLQSGSRGLWSSLAASALLLGAATASAQTPPDQQPPPPADVTAPPPPPAEPSPAAVEGETFPRMGKSHEIMVAKDVWFRFGLQAQVWADWLQSSTRVNGSDGAYSQNMFLRRARFIAAAQFLKNVNVWFQFDAPRLGQALAGGTTDAPTATKRFNAQDGGGEILQDAWGEIKLAGDALMLEVGLMVIPFARNELQSTTTFLTLDIGNTSALVPNTSGTRDLGFELKGYLLEDHLEYRAGIFSGARQPVNATAGNPVAHNFFRLTGMLQYDVFDVEKGYVYAGHNFGKKKILAVNAGFDFQKNDAPQTDAYFALSGAVAVAWPLAGEGNPKGGDEIAGLLQYYHYDGGGTTGAAASLLKQDDFLGEVAYYNKDLGLSVFGKFEMQHFSDDAAKANNTLWFGGGIKYYIFENLCNFTLAFNRAQFPDADSNVKNGTNELTLQAQVFYY